MYITPSELEDFIGKYPEEGDEKPLSYCKSAIEVIHDFLGYDPEQQEYTTVIRGDGGVYASLYAFPITEIVSFKIDGIDQPITRIEVSNKNLIRFEDDARFLAGHKYEITYKAGYKSIETVVNVYSADGITFFKDANFTEEAAIPEGVTPEATENENEYSYSTFISTVPEVIKTTAKQIGSLFWESAGGNLAVNSTSFADTGTRVFNNFTADRFLNQIVSYKRNI